MHPKEKTDTITIMEKIGHFLDDAVRKLYKKGKLKGLTKIETSQYIVENINLAKNSAKISHSLGWRLRNGWITRSWRFVCI